MNKILVTGCAGFIGSSLIDALILKFPNTHIIGIDNFDIFYNKTIKINNMQGFINHPHFSFQELDLTLSQSFAKLPKVDIVIHLAAKAGVRPSIAYPKQYIESNIIATQNILNWIKNENIKKYIFASSSSVYGNNKNIPFSELDNVDYPISPYAFTKKSCELLNYTYFHLYHIDCINLRFFTVYGPRQRPDLAIHKFVQQILSNEVIEVFGDGSTSRDYTYISDIVEGILSAIHYVINNNNIYEIINLGNNCPIKLMKLIKLIEQYLQIKAKLKFKPLQDGDVNITYANIDKAMNLLSYNPKISIEEGIKKFILWVKIMKN